EISVCVTLLVRPISNTIGEACGREVEEVRLPSGTKIYNNWVLTFFWELPLENVAPGDLIATENPLVLESLPPHLTNQPNDAAEPLSWATTVTPPPTEVGEIATAGDDRHPFAAARRNAEAMR